MDSSVGTIFIHSASIPETVKVHGLGYCLRPRGNLWSVLSPETMWKSVIHAAADYKGQGSYFSSGIDDGRLTVVNERHRKFL